LPEHAQDADARPDGAEQVARDLGRAGRRCPYNPALSNLAMQSLDTGRFISASRTIRGIAVRKRNEQLANRLQSEYDAGPSGNTTLPPHRLV